MEYLIDSHCHLHDREFYTDDEAEACLIRAREKGVKKIICIGTSHEDSMAAREFALDHDNVYWTYGVHPEETGRLEVCFSRDFGGCCREEAPEPREDGREGRGPRKDIPQSPIAIGEVGLDYHYEGYKREAQIRLFEQMLQLAVDNDLPVSFHIREAFADFFPVVANFPEVRGVVHSFTDSKKVLKRILSETGFYIGVNGLATYSTLPTPPLERTLLETDAPFLKPRKVRGTHNIPNNIVWVVRRIAQERGIPEEEVRTAVLRTTTRFFGIPVQEIL